MNLKVLLVLLPLLAQASAQGLAAHHSTPVNFDQSREITIEGVLTEVVWRNPHSRFRVDVTGGALDASGGGIHAPTPG